MFGKKGQKLSKIACQQILYVACSYYWTSIIQKPLIFQNILAIIGSFWWSERYRNSWYLTLIVSIFCKIRYHIKQPFLGNIQKILIFSITSMRLISWSHILRKFKILQYQIRNQVYNNCLNQIVAILKMLKKKLIS